MRTLDHRAEQRRFVELDGERYRLSRLVCARAEGRFDRVLLAYRQGHPRVVTALSALTRSPHEVEFALRAGLIRVDRVPRPDVTIDEAMPAVDLVELAGLTGEAEVTTFIAFSVVDQDGEPHDGAEYELMLPNGRASEGAASGGRVFIPGLEPGQGDLTLFERGRRDQAGSEVDDPGGGTSAVDVGAANPGRGPVTPPHDQDPAAGTSHYEVRVLDASLEPIAGLPLLFAVAGGSAVATTSADGVARIDGVAPGAGSARLLDPAALAAALAGRKPEAGVSPEPHPDRVVVTPNGLSNGLGTHSDSSLEVVLLTAFDLFFSPGQREEISLVPTSELISLETGPFCVVRARATGEGNHVLVEEPATEALGVLSPLDAPEPGPLLWSAPNLYHVQPGDFLVKIAATYLGHGERWPEIWALNKDRMPGRSPDDLFAGDTLVMPPAAVPSFVSAVEPLSPPETRPPNLPASPWMNLDVEDLADALAAGNLEPVLDALSEIPTQPPPPPPTPELGIMGEQALFTANLVQLAFEGEVDLPPEDLEQV